jgi:serine/threonine protein kinase
MSNIVRLKTVEGDTVEFVDEVKASGGVKDVYFSPNRDYVVAFFRGPADPAAKDRLQLIAGTYRDRIFNQEGGQYWRNLFCWPTGVVEHAGRLGVTAPFYQSNFFFQHGSRNQDFLQIRGKEKEGKWFASASNRSKFLDEKELGDWLSHLRICLLISRAVRRLHAAGLAHSDLSYKNVLIDPTTGAACVIDVDGLVVPGKIPPQVVGTPDFIDPLVIMSSKLPLGDPKRVLPSIRTDQHALSVLIYMYLLYRHPLRGDQVHDINDTQRDEEMAMGERALWVEDKANTSNRIKVKNLKPSQLPWMDTARLPYTITGPYLAPLFERAFTAGLHNPAARPTADEWEMALVKTVDLVQPCQNSACGQKWYVFDNTKSPCCPFCGTPYQGRLPVLNLYSSHKPGEFRPDNHRLMVYSNQSLFPWHVKRNVFPNEKLAESQKQRVGYFVLHNGHWWLVNERMPALFNADTKAQIPIGDKVELVEGLKLVSKEDGGRLVLVQLVGG